ncbi:DNA polymerase zeta processivity subunit-like [Prunus avium]|uniref:DNA polymerase zeta processivity subunit-like n=1 Tax=Prunus avium TaxID=42229 RepID=A0A6P5SX12_PRUAV|nr:DNA polymerase zeta processivity subunit-like [Prunus avium]
MDRKDNQYPQGETVRILVEFPEVAITSIVFLKGIYPPGDFEIRKYVNLVVHSARHPELRDYIHSAVSGLHPFIQKGLVERVVVIFFNSDSILVERFMFKLTVNQSYGLRVEEADLEFSLRSLFIELPFAESLTRVLPQVLLEICLTWRPSYAKPRRDDLSSKASSLALFCREMKDNYSILRF